MATRLSNVRAACDCGQDDTYGGAPGSPPHAPDCSSVTKRFPKTRVERPIYRVEWDRYAHDSAPRLIEYAAVVTTKRITVQSGPRWREYHDPDTLERRTLYRWSPLAAWKAFLHQQAEMQQRAQEEVERAVANIVTACDAITVLENTEGGV